MASLAEHLSQSNVAAEHLSRPQIAAELAPIGLFCMSLTLFVFSCSLLAHCHITPPRR